MILEKIPSISFTSDKIHFAGMLLFKYTMVLFHEISS